MKKKIIRFIFKRALDFVCKHDIDYREFREFIAQFVLIEDILCGYRVTHAVHICRERGELSKTYGTLEPYLSSKNGLLTISKDLPSEYPCDFIGGGIGYTGGLVGGTPMPMDESIVKNNVVDIKKNLKKL